MYYQDAEAAIVVYDVTFRGSFDSARNWVRELKESATVHDILVALVGNKSDLQDKIEVSTQNGMEFKQEIGADVFRETSAKDNVGINDLFREIGVKLYKKEKQKVSFDYLDLTLYLECAD